MCNTVRERNAAHESSAGACWAYVAGMKSKLNSYGPLKAVTMVFDIQSEDYFPRHAEQASLIVMVEHGAYLPRPEIRGFPVGPGTDTRVELSARLIRRTPYPYQFSNCGNADDARYLLSANSWALKTNGTPTYAWSTCMYDCLYRAIHEQCACIDADLTTYDQASESFGTDVESCDRDASSAQRECVKAVTRRTFDAKDTLCAKGEGQPKVKSDYLVCPASCEEWDVRPLVTSVVWPRQDYYRAVADVWNRAVDSSLFVNASMERMHQLLAEANSRQTKNLARLAVYRKNAVVEVVTELPMMNMWEFLSNVGGIVGLYGGMSLLTILEVAEIALLLAAHGIKHAHIHYTGGVEAVRSAIASRRMTQVAVESATASTDVDAPAHSAQAKKRNASIRDQSDD